MRDVVGAGGSVERIAKLGLQAMQEETEQYMVDHFTSCVEVMCHAKRLTILVVREPSVPPLPAPLHLR